MDKLVKKMSSLCGRLPFLAVFLFLNQAIVDASYTTIKIRRLVSYEIHFTRSFYTYEAPRLQVQIQGEIQQLEHDILKKLPEISGALV